jgi:hypothetical protein
MFVPDQTAAANELTRVLRPGGRLALASCCPDGVVGELFVMARHAPPPPGGVPPFQGGTREGLDELLGDRVEWTRRERVSQRVRYASASALVGLFATYGPTMKALGRVQTEEARQAFLSDLEAMYSRTNVATNGTYAADWDYLLAVGVRS